MGPEETGEVDGERCLWVCGRQRQAGTCTCLGVPAWSTGARRRGIGVAACARCFLQMPTPLTAALPHALRPALVVFVDTECVLPPMPYCHPKVRFFVLDEADR